MSKNHERYSQSDIDFFMQFPSVFEAVRADRVRFTYGFRTKVWAAGNGSPTPQDVRNQLRAVSGSDELARRIKGKAITNLASHIRRDGKPERGSGAVTDVISWLKADPEYSHWMMEKGLLKPAKNGKFAFTDKLRLIALNKSEILTVEQALEQAGIDLSRFGYQRLRTLIRETKGGETLRSPEELNDSDRAELSQSPFISSVTSKQIRYRKCFDEWSEKLRDDLSVDEILNLFGLHSDRLSPSALLRLIQRVRYHCLNRDAAPALPELPGGEEYQVQFLSRYYQILKSRLDNGFKAARSLWPRMKSSEKRQICQIIQAGTSPEDGFSLSSLLKASGIPRSSWYRLTSSESGPDRILKREQRDKEDLEAIREIVNYKGFKKGSRQVRLQFQNATGRTISLTRLRRLMRENGLECGIRTKSSLGENTKRMIRENTKPNLLRRRFRLNRPGEVLLTDVSYLDYGSGLENRAYLSAVKDSSSGRILALLVSDSQDASLGAATIECLPDSNSSLLHSDQGTLYLNPAFQAQLASKGYEQSMSRRGNCWDNSSMESFFGHFKDECPYRNCQSLEELRNLVNEYAIYYNTERPQPARNNMTPDEFEKYLNRMTEEQWDGYLQTETVKYNKMLEKAAQSAIERYRIDKAVAGNSEYGQKKCEEIEKSKKSRYLQDDAGRAEKTVCH